VCTSPRHCQHQNKQPQEENQNGLFAHKQPILHSRDWAIIERTDKKMDRKKRLNHRHLLQTT
jgi:hypothetical protein